MASVLLLLTLGLSTPPAGGYGPAVLWPAVVVSDTETEPNPEAEASRPPIPSLAPAKEVRLSMSLPAGARPPRVGNRVKIRHGAAPRGRK